MIDDTFHITSSGVRLYADFKDNLIIDQDDPIFGDMRVEKVNDLASENSEDAITWNVFRSLRRNDPALWLPSLFKSAFGRLPKNPIGKVCVELWPKFGPPSSLAHREGQSEIDIVIMTAHIVWFIEAKYKSDIALSVTHRKDRDQIIRNIDVGSWHAGQKDFYFSLLGLDPESSPDGYAKIRHYMAARENILAALPHRDDGITNLQGVSWLTWADMADVLADCAELAPRADERAAASRALEWLKLKGIHSRHGT